MATEIRYFFTKEQREWTTQDLQDIFAGTLRPYQIRGDMVDHELDITYKRSSLGVPSYFYRRRSKNK